MAKNAEKVIVQAEKGDASAAAKRVASHSLSVGFKKHFTVGEQSEIKIKRRELRQRLVAAG